MQFNKRKTTEAGLTLIESLAAIMVIAAIIIAITPSMLIAYATRVQNYRKQNATQIAQGEIDRVKRVIEGGEYTGDDLVAQLPPEVGTNDFDIVSKAAPANNPTVQEGCPLKNVTGSTDFTTNLCGVDINGDGDWDLAVQTFRTSGFDTKNNPLAEPVAFLMGVRVYTRAAIESNRISSSDVGRFPRFRKVPNIVSGESLVFPLESFYTPVVRSDLPVSLELYCNLYRNMGNPAPDGCPGS